MLKRILYRFKQFFFAMTASMFEEDRVYARQYLDIKESAFFFGLPDYEQKHSVIVAQKMQKFAHNRTDLDIKLLVRLGLLHDIGKAATRLSVIDKSLLVILQHFLHPLYDYLASKGADDRSFFLFRKFYVHKNHGRIGSEMLKRVGVDPKLSARIFEHDENPIEFRDEYMKILNQSDSTC